MAIDYHTIISNDKVADFELEGLLDFTRMVLEQARVDNIENRFHTIEADPEPIPREQTDRIYIRDSKSAGHRCYLYINLEHNEKDAYVGFGELQHSGNDPTWGGWYYPQTSEGAKAVVHRIKNELK